MSRRATIKDVARVAGVSTVTVSRVANAPALVRPETRARVEQAMLQLGYAPNALIQETVRAFYTGWYKELVTELPDIRNGFIHPMTGPGLGTRLQPGVLERKDATIRRTDKA